MATQNSVLLVFSALICTAVAMKCTKMMITRGDVSSSNDEVFSEGLYHIKTILPHKSEEIRELATSLVDEVNLEFHHRGFIATLEPKHIKKVYLVNHTPHF